MDELTAWSRDLTVEVGGHGVASHTGSAALRLLADRSGLTGACPRRCAAAGSPRCTTEAGSWPRPPCLLLDGWLGDVGNLVVLRDQGELFGSVASDSTRRRASEEIGPDELERMAAEVRDRGGFRSPARRVEQQPQSLEDDLIARMQRPLADDPSSVQNVPLRDPRSWTSHASPNCSNTACTRETPSASTTRRSTRECSDSHPLGVQRSKLPPASAQHLDIAAHRESQARRQRRSSQPALDAGSTLSVALRGQSEPTARSGPSSSAGAGPAAPGSCRPYPSYRDPRQQERVLALVIERAAFMRPARVGLAPRRFSSDTVSYATAMP